MLDRQAQNDLREEANLLYVAMTRARQYLFISGNQKEAAAADSWYGLIARALSDWDTTADGHPCHETGHSGELDTVLPTAGMPVTPDPRLSGPVAVPERQRLIAPSRALHAATMENGDTDGRERGIAIHLMLQQLGTTEPCCPEAIPATIANALQREINDPVCQAWWQEAIATVQAPQLQWLFDHTRYQQAFNEVPIQYLDGNRMVYGIIDRLVINNGTAWVIDYKTHQRADPDSLPRLAESYREQMRLYASGVQQLWPGLSVKPCLLFTACGELVEMHDHGSADSLL